MIRPFSRASRWRLPLALVAVLSVLVLAGCGASTSTDALVAARVNGDGISLADYQALLAFDEASAALPGSSGQLGTNTAWQTPDGRTGLAQQQRAALNTLVNLQLDRQQLRKLHITVPASISNDARAQLRSAIALANNDPRLKPLLAVLTPRVQDLLVEQEADQQTLIAHVQVSSIHVRVIVVPSQQQADDLLKQLQNGADFAQLAMQVSQDAQSAQAGGEVGTVYSGQFGPQLATAHDKYVIVPISGQYAIFEVTQPATRLLSALTNPQASFSAWLSMAVRAHSNIQTDVAVA